MPEGDHIKDGILKGMYKFSASELKKPKAKAHLFGSAITVPIARKAAEILEKDYKVATDVWSVTSYIELRRDGLDCERENMLNPEDEKKVPYVTQMLEKEEGVFIANSDYMKIQPDGIRQWVPGAFRVLVLMALVAVTLALLYVITSKSMSVTWYWRL